MTPYPRRVPAIVARALRLGWEVSLSRPKADAVDLYLRETAGREYTFSLQWSRRADSWEAPRAQNVETVVEYITRAELEQGVVR